MGIVDIIGVVLVIEVIARTVGWIVDRWTRSRPYALAPPRRADAQ